MTGVFTDLKNELFNLASETASYTSNTLSSLNPLIVALGSFISFLLFPSEVYITYAGIVLIMILLDLVTKYYALSENNGGLINAFRTGVIKSNIFWNGTRKKIISYLVVMIMIGLAHNFNQLTSTVEFIAVFMYMMMFLRESQSVAENLIESGSDMEWLLLFLKRREREVVEKVNRDQENEVNIDVRIEREKLHVNEGEEYLVEKTKTIEKKVD